MDDKLLQNLKSFSVKDILEDGESLNRAGTAKINKRRSKKPFDDSKSDLVSSVGDAWGKSSSLFSEGGSSGGNLFSRTNTYNNDDIKSTWNMSTESLQKSSDNIRPVTSSSRKQSFSGDTLIEFIPDLDEVQEEDLTMQLASAPSSEMQGKITSIKELDAELLQKSKPFSSIDNYDLTILTKFIVPEKNLIEHDEIWDTECIFTEIASDLFIQTDKRELQV